jgi:TusA-related sulfurtransferase
MPTIDEQLDVRGYCCPLPLIRIRKVMDRLTRGQVLQVLGDDPIFEESVRDLSNEMRYTVLNVNRVEQHFVVQLQR